MSKKRILWLFNHTSLRKFEVPLLIDMGYEVYCPKICDIEFGDYSTSISYEYDACLSIPQGDIERLNRVNFYQALDMETMALVNQYFDIAFCLFHIPPLNSLATHFKGVLLLHIFGISNGANYTQILQESGGIGLLKRLDKMGERFFFAPTYDNISEIECTLLQRRTMFLPIGVSLGRKQAWTGGDERFLFISPKIKTNTYYTRVYEEFKKGFDELPHVIGGAQPQPVPEDPCVTGFLSDEEYHYNMTRLCAMYYHSQEKRHLHYHPLEAIHNGMPLVFMAGGMLDHLGGENLPGRCRTVKEAKEKLRRLAAGDRRLIEQITSTQTVLLKPFTREYCLPYWQAGMQRIEESLELAREKKQQRKRIAVIMPAAYTGGVLDYSIRFALCLKSRIKAGNDHADVIFAYPNSRLFMEKDYFAPLRKAGIPLRSFDAELKGTEWVHRSLVLAGFEPENRLNLWNTVSVFNDQIDFFSDCDYAVVTADACATEYPFYLTIPHAVVAHDYIQRYVPGVISPEADDVKLANQRAADAVLVTSIPTYEDAIAYAGLKPERIRLTPHLCDVQKQPINGSTELTGRKGKQLEPRGFFLWPTNAAPHKNHLVALSALEKYYQNGGSLECVITGTNTKAFRKKTDIREMSVLPDYVRQVREKIEQSSSLKRHLHILGNLPKEEYRRYLSAAAFLFHPCYGDNGTFSVLDAAAVGTPSLSSDYPAMRYLADFAGVELRYTDPFDSGVMADALLAMEDQHRQYAQQLPDIETLSRCTYEAKAEELYGIVRELAGI